jgi:acyl-coenzyme A synthetase/AMP-(fatty) acid ligase
VIHLALINNKILRVRGDYRTPGSQVMANGIGVPSTFDPAIQDSGVLFGGRGVEAALSQFDPIFNTQIYLLDAHLQPVPVGVAGELCIAGEGMARGYLNRPDSTAEKFVPNPFCQEPGGLMYRSGDVARYRRDGNLEFLGRCDDQVKIRGFRVETGEVETAMMEHSNVQQAVVVVDEHKPGEKRLIAYLVLKESVANAEKEVRAFLKDKLPVYMIPSAYVLLDVLPLSVNGKIDRRLLPPASTARTEFTEISGTTDDPLGSNCAGLRNRIGQKAGAATRFLRAGDIRYSPCG